MQYKQLSLFDTRSLKPPTRPFLGRLLVGVSGFFLMLLLLGLYVFGGIVMVLGGVWAIWTGDNTGWQIAGFGFVLFGVGVVLTYIIETWM